MSSNGDNKNLTVGQDSNQNDQIIHNALQILEKRIDELKGDIGISKSMLPLNVDTDLTAEMKKWIKNPLAQFVNVKKDMDATIATMITELLKKFFVFHKDKVQKAIIIDNGNNNHELHFGIILKNDNEENRGAVYSILTDYKSTSLWEDFPIYFQILPKGIAERINQKEVIVEN